MFTKFLSEEEALSWALNRLGKARPIAKISNLDGMMKSWTDSDGNVHFEGWVSTPHRDIEGDIVEPEAFSGDGLAGYMQRGAPVSTEHQTKSLPVGYLVKSALVRGGQVIQEEINPKNPGNFKYPADGTGWYAHGLVYDEAAKRGVINGTVSSFSWIGMPKDWIDLPGKGRQFKKAGSINPVIETTITAYPINTQATMRLAKAAGAVALTDKDIYQLLLNDPKLADEFIKLAAPGVLDRARDRTRWVIRRFTSPDDKPHRNYFSKE